MLLRLLSEPAEGLVYSCEEPGCLVRYDSAHGYFLDTEDAKTIEQETLPHVSCSNDGQLMYLAEVDPEEEASVGGNVQNANSATLMTRRPRAS
jgi:hypothetical protein